MTNENDTWAGDDSTTNDAERTADETTDRVGSEFSADVDTPRHNVPVDSRSQRADDAVTATPDVEPADEDTALDESGAAPGDSTF